MRIAVGADHAGYLAVRRQYVDALCGQDVPPPAAETEEADAAVFRDALQGNVGDIVCFQWLGPQAEQFKGMNKE